MEASQSNRGTTGKRKRRGVVRTLVVVGALVAFLGTFALWANRQLLETETWGDTSERLIQDPEIRTQVSNFLVDTLYANVDVQAELQAAFPPRLQPLAGPLSGALRQLADKAATEALQRPRVIALWRQANENAQKTLVNVVENGGDEPVTLDVGTIVDQLGTQLGVDAAGKVPPHVANIQIASNDDLVKVNDLLNILKTLAWLLIALALVLWGLAIYLAEGWRREALRSIGWAFIIVGILVLAIRALAGNVVVNQLVPSDEVQPAAHNAWSIGTSLLNDQGGAAIFYGIFIVIGAWLAGPMGLARRARRAIAPILENRWTAYGALALLLILLFWWAPTPAFHRVPTSVLLIVLLVVGLEFLRHKAIKDFPDETWEGATQRWSAAIDRRTGGST